MGGRFGKGGGGLGSMEKLMKNMQKMQADMTSVQEALVNSEVEASVGGGAVKAVVNGKGKLLRLTIKPEAVDPEDVEMLQDLIVSAVNEAETKAEEIETEKMQGVAGDVPLPPGLF